MNIFDAHITGSLSVSSSAEISGDLTVLGTINATISGTTSNAISASHAANYTLTSSFGDFTSSYTTGSFTGSFIGDGSGLTNIPASGVTGLNLTQIADGSVTASVSDTNGLRVNSKSEITGSLIVTNGITGSIDYSNITNKPTLVSGSSQVDITSTTGYSTFSSSISSSIGLLSSSVANTNFIQDGYITSIVDKTGSYATTGSNMFIGNQTVTGSVIITQNLQVLGSSSFLYVTSSQLNVSSSTISVNVFEPAERFGGLKIYDSGSSAATASFLWDSLNNRFVYQNVDGAAYSGAVFISGPRNSGSLGDEPLLTSGKIPKSVGGDHIDNSIMSEVGGNTIAISGSLVITGSIVSTVTPLVSGSPQVISLLPTGTVSGSSQVLSGTGIWSGSAQLPSGIISGSSQLPSGIVSGSSQITFGSVSGVPSGLVSGSSQITFGSVSGIPSGIVSGSSQITYSSISGIPSGIVSGSSQITLSSTNGFGTYINQAVLTSSSPTFAGLTSNNSATLYRDVYINGGASGNYGNRLIIGATSATYTMEDTNLRPVIYSTGAYPVLTLNHTVTGNGSHGPTIQFTHSTADKQWVIGTNGTGTQMDFGYSSDTNRNPHNGIDNYQGNTYLRISNSGNITTWANIIPSSNGALNLGGSSNRWNTVFTSDLSLSNGIGDYTIVEGENDLFLYNNIQNKVYKFMLQEVNPSDATPKRPE